MGGKIIENTRYKILLIEDDKLDQMAFMRMVQDKELPYDCTVAGSVSEAKSILGRDRFDIIIADYSLGDGTAFDIVNLAKNTSIIFATGAGDEEIAVKAWKEGAYDYLIKDLEQNYLKTVPITIENAVRHKKIKEQLQLLSGAIMSTADSVYITDLEGKIIFVNRAFCKTYGYSKEEIIGKDSNILWIGKTQSQNTRSVFGVTGSTRQVGFYHRRKDDSVFPVSLSRSIIKDSNGKEIAVGGVARDISERMQVENELRSANLQLKKQNQLKNEFAITVCRQLMTLADEFKNIVSDAMTGAQGKISPELQENLDHAEKGINGFRRIVSEFLDISQLEAGKMKLQFAELSLCSVISDVVEALSPLAEERHIELKSFMPDSELAIEANRSRITQALWNLINNAIKSTPSNGHISVRAEDIGNEVMVVVEDDGPAIESSRIVKSFNRFTQIRMKLHPGREEESALGLPIARELLEMHGGCIWIESGDGQGNCLCFTLPKSAVQEAVASMSAREEGKYYGN